MIRMNKTRLSKKSGKDICAYLWTRFSLTEEQLQICKKKKKPKRVYLPFDEDDAIYGVCGCGGVLEDDYGSESMFEGAFGFSD